MKIRNGFVSNSSSSSFICEVCVEEQSGWDLGLEEVGMYECVNGHYFCEDHAVSKRSTDMDDIRKYCLESGSSYSKEEILKMKDEELTELAEEYDYFVDERYECPVSMCPICSFLEVQNYDAYRYLLKKAGLTQETMLKQLKTEFTSYDEFRKSIAEIK